MDADRFDTIARVFGSRTSRRLAIGLAASGLLSLTVPDAAAARCSAAHPCPECKKCKHHRCRPDATQTSCNGGAGACVKGTCCPVQRACGSTCCPLGKQCSGGICVPLCGGFLAPCDDDGDCCSGSCVPAFGTKACTCSPAGKVCQSGSDCCSGLTCVGFFCQ